MKIGHFIIKVIMATDLLNLNRKSLIFGVKMTNFGELDS